jgi:L-rhamnose mutarotase
MQKVISIGLALTLRPNCYEEYKRRHDELWPELTQVMRECGVSMVIYRFENHLFIHETVPSQEALDRMSKHPIGPRWDAYMAEVVETDAAGIPIRQKLPLSFAFGDFA